MLIGTANTQRTANTMITSHPMYRFPTPGLNGLQLRVEELRKQNGQWNDIYRQRCKSVVSRCHYVGMGKNGECKKKKYSHR